MNSISKKIVRNSKNIVMVSLYVSFVVLPFLIFSYLFPDLLKHYLSVIEQHDWVFRIARWIIILLIILLWPKIIDRMGTYFDFPLEKIAYWKRQTGRIALWLIMFEAIVVENIVGKLIHLL